MSRGSVTSYQTSEGLRWQYRIELPPHPDGRRRQKTQRGFLTEKLAWQAARKAMTKRDEGQYIEPSKERLDVYLARWLETTSTSRKPGTTLSYEGHLKHISRSIGHVPLGRLTAMDVQRALDALHGSLAPRTIRAVYRTLVIALRQAVRWRILERNPVDGVVLPAVDPVHMVVWSIEEQQRFLVKTADHWLSPLWHLLLDTGMRVGEAQALRWGDLNLTGPSPTVRIERTVTDDRQGREVIGQDTKTYRSKREVAIASETAETLKAHGRRRREQGFGWKPDDLVFDNGRGGLLRYDRIRYNLIKFATLAEVPIFGLHGLRKTMVVTWLRAGVSPRVVSDRVGHHDTAFTLNIYSSVSHEWQSESLERVAAFRQKEIERARDHEREQAAESG